MQSSALISLPGEQRSNLYISSEDRIYGSSSDFTVQMQQSINNIKSLKLEAAAIPISWYPIQPAYYHVPLAEGANPTVNVSVPTGWYTPPDLATALATALNSASPGGATYTVTYSTLTGKYTIASTTSFSLPWATDIAAYPSNFMEYVLGWQKSPDTTPAVSVTSPGVGTMNDLFVSLVVKPVTTNAYTCTTTVASTSFTIPVLGNQEDIIYYLNNGTGYSQQLDYQVPSINLRELTITLRHISGQVVDLNGAPIALVFSYSQHNIY